MMREAHKLILSRMFITLVAYCHLFVSDAIVVLNVNTTAGESTVLPCTLMSTSIDLKDLRFHWQDDRNDVLYSFNKGKEMSEYVTELYRDRVTAFPEDMTRGNISVTVKNLTLEDGKRTIRAFASVLNSAGKWEHSLNICPITLNVAVPYKTVSLEVNEKDMKAVCTVQRGFPEPLVSWRLQHLFNDSKHWSDPRNEHTKAVQDAEDHLYNVSSTIGFNGGQYQNVTCIIYNPTLNVTLSKTYVFNKGKHLWGLPVWASILIAAATVLLVTTVITT